MEDSGSHAVAEAFADAQALLEDAIPSLITDTNPVTYSIQPPRVVVRCGERGYSSAQRRTKIVFHDSSDDDTDDKAGEMKRIAVEVAVDSEYNLEMDEAELVDEDYSPPHGSSPGSREQSPPSCFIEDTKGVEEPARICEISHTTEVSVDATHQSITSSSRHHVVDVLVHGSGRITQLDADGRPTHPRRRKQRAPTGPVLSTRKRYRDDDDVGEGTHTADDTVHVEEEILGEDKAATIKVVDGYRFTLDENDVQEIFSDDDEDFDEEDGDLDDLDEEEEEALDNLCLVSSVEQLVRCCEAEMDETPQYTRFVEKAKTVLKQLYDKEIDVHQFNELMHRDVFGLQKMFRRMNRPRDEPIIVNGVLMDM